MLIEFPDEIPDENDTIARDNLDRIMNDITRKYYGFTLLKCPNCGSIIPAYGDERVSCNSCLQYHEDLLDQDECPDLFFSPYFSY